MTAFIGILIVVLFAARPFVYKEASKSLDPAVSSYFTAVWCLIFALPTMPFCKDYLFIDGRFALFTPAVFFPLLKGVSLFCFMKLSQIVNKENTSGSVFWGVISLGLFTLVSTFVFDVPLAGTKLIVILFIGLAGTLFFIFGEGRSLSPKAKKAFIGLVFFATLNNSCDTAGIKYANWYVLYTVPTVGMLLCSLIAARKALPLKAFFTTRHIVLAGVVYAAGEMVVIFSMQSFFPVVTAVFLIRLAQSVDLLLAYHLTKEGKAGVQYFFALGTIALSYFFFFSK